MIKINAPSPGFTEDAYINDQEKKIPFKEYRGKWVILFFSRQVLLLCVRQNWENWRIIMLKLKQKALK